MRPKKYAVFLVAFIALMDGFITYYKYQDSEYAIYFASGAIAGTLLISYVAFILSYTITKKWELSSMLFVVIATFAVCGNISRGGSNQNPKKKIQDIVSATSTRLPIDLGGGLSLRCIAVIGDKIVYTFEVSPDIELNITNEAIEEFKRQSLLDMDRNNTGLVALIREAHFTILYRLRQNGKVVSEFSN